MQDPLDPPAFGVLARHHAIAGRRQLGRLDPDLLDTPGQFRGQVQVMHADRGLGREIRQQPAVLGQQRAVRTRPALDAPQDGALVLDRHGRGRLAGWRAVRDHSRRPAGRLQRYPGPGQVQAAADLPGQVAQQPVRAGHPGQALAEAAEAGVARQPRAEHPAVRGVLQTAPNGLARSRDGHRDRHGDRGRRDPADQHAGQDGQDGEHDGDRYPQDPVHERAPGRLVDTEYPGIEHCRQQRSEGGGEPQVGQRAARGRGGRVVRVGHLIKQGGRDPQAGRDRQAQEQPAYPPALGPVGVPVAQREQHHPDHRPGRERAVCRFGGSAQRRQGRHP